MIIPRDGPNLGPRAAQGPFLKFGPSLTVVTMVSTLIIIIEILLV